MKKVNGFWYKTINIPTSNGTREYMFRGANTNDLDLPIGSEVVGIFCRRFQFGANDRNYEGVLLANFDVNKNTFFDLKGYREYPEIQKGKKLRNIIELYKYDYLTGPPLFIERGLVTSVDWAHSPIMIGNGCPTASIVDDESFEFIVVYLPPKCEEIGEAFEFRTGQIYENEKYISLSIPTQAGKISYKISNQNSVGIDDECIVIGLDIRPIGRNFSGIPDLASAARQCGFLNLYLKNDKNFNFIDNLPINLDGYPQADWNKPYLPIAPIRVGDVAWEKSSLNFSDVTAPQNNQEFSFGIIYVEPGK